MGKLIRLELYNFKSYRGHHIFNFGDSYWTSIIGPNGSGTVPSVAVDARGVLPAIWLLSYPPALTFTTQVNPIPWMRLVSFWA